MGENMRQVAGAVVDQIASLVYPPRCAVCDRVLRVGQFMHCPGCLGHLRPVKEPLCCKCGKPLAEEALYCTDCAQKQTTFLYGYGMFVYDRALQTSILRFKYHGRREYAAFYAFQMYQKYGSWLAANQIQALVPVPVHKNRFRKRGYNQAALLARELGRLTGIPVREDLVLRCRDTLPQKQMGGAVNRLANLREAFCPGEIRAGHTGLQRVVLIDDIYTTGSTIEACAQVLCALKIPAVFFLTIGIGE